jgi:hypothetical protein
MGRTLRAVTIASALLAAGAGGATAAPLPTRLPLATVSSTVETRSFVSRLDPLTLAPRGPRVELGEFHDGWSFSPDGSQIAFGKSPAGGNTPDGIRVVDVARLTLVQTIRTNIFVGPLAWLAPHELVGLLAGTRPVVFDPAAPAAAQGTTGFVGAGCGFPPTVTTRRALVGLNRRGLFTVDGRGRVDITRLHVGDCRRAGLAVEARSAWVLPAGSKRLAEVDLRSGSVVQHNIRGRARSPRYSSTLVPLGRERFAVAYQSAAGARGVELLDTRFGGRFTISARDGGVSFGAGTALAFGAGVTGFTPNGRIRFRLLRADRVSDVEVEGRFAYAIGRRGVSIIDIRAGRVVHRSPGAARDVEIGFLHPGNHPPIS